MTKSYDNHPLALTILLVELWRDDTLNTMALPFQTEPGTRAVQKIAEEEGYTYTHHLNGTRRDVIKLQCIRKSKT